MAQFRFVMRSGPAAGKVYPLEAPDISIGRDGINTIVINDAEVSRRHARMELRGAAYVIQDLGSTNGTFVNGARIRGIQVLNAGDTVAFGEGIVLAYEAAVDVNATILSEKAPQTIIQQISPRCHSSSSACTCTCPRTCTRPGLLGSGSSRPDPDACRDFSEEEKIPGVVDHRDRVVVGPVRLRGLLRDY